MKGGCVKSVRTILKKFPLQNQWHKLSIKVFSIRFSISDLKQSKISYETHTKEKQN